MTIFAIVAFMILINSTVVHHGGTTSDIQTFELVTPAKMLQQIRVLITLHHIKNLFVNFGIHVQVSWID